MIEVPARRALLALTACIAFSANASEPVPDVVPLIHISLDGELTVEWTSLPHNIVPGYVGHVCFSNFDPINVTYYFINFEKRAVFSLDAKRNVVKIEVVP